MLMAFGTGACRDTGSTTQPTTKTRTSASAPTAAQSASSAPSGTTAARYLNRRDVCSTLDHARLTRALGADAGNLGKPRFSDTRISSLANCDRQYGPAGMRSLISLEVMTSKVGSVQAFYEGMRGAQQRSTAVADVPGVGQQAAVYTDPTTGPHLVVYDGNLYLSIALIPVNSSATEQLNTQELLVACAQHVLDELRQR
ncbi:hypothetical protein COUCH_14360 [Couchioplanes caeruleus]|uniref:hypothetical protein n=1 Tax=Couchioplanes caeruleus TaxID=56438 RepID=UPI0020BDF6BD|nr:hypothetical protein [Couchioplanes caeruleus]UQU67372.1 hypothetical protein COUCH_14360 [Couchioplanes caeruleus]